MSTKRLPMKKLEIRLEEQAAQWLRGRSKELDIPLSELVRRCIDRVRLEREQLDYYDLDFHL